MKPAVTDPPEVQHYLWNGFTGEVGWDIGANCGQTLGEMTARFSTVIAFEPAVECWDYLVDVEGVHVLPIAVSDVDTVVDLVELPDKIATGQLVTAGTVGMEWNPDDPRARVRRITSRKIDTLVTRSRLTPPNFLKIDVEGHELRVLHGARQTLTNYQPDILLEFHSRELHRACVDLLVSHGYDCFTVRHPHYRPGADLWFTHGWVRAKKTSNPDGVDRLW